MSSLQKQLLKNKLPPMVPRGFGSASRARQNMRKREYTPLTWQKYFTEAKDVQVSQENVFRVYMKGSTGPLLLMLHGGGYSGLTWSLFAEYIVQMAECQVAAVDIRGHGETVTTDETNLSADMLSNDIGAIYNTMYPDTMCQPPVILIGHSMGGAVAVHTAAKGSIYNLLGLIVLDVVEGTAIDALQSMQTFLKGRPQTFSSLEYAIEWCVRSGQVRNLESARVSMPSQLKNMKTGQPATKELCEPQATSPRGEELEAHDSPVIHSPNSIAEEVEEDGHHASHESSHFTSPYATPQQENTVKYTWRIDLSKTEEHWRGWFAGLSSLFLSVPVPKLLLLAGVDRLDRDLTIGQMQGKFQMQVLPQCGHAVHEDVPDKVAEAVATFLVRNKFTEPLSGFQR
ncbi:protein phosphatase methylesterase 1-like isoform X2 [Ornithodoros turicata]